MKRKISLILEMAIPVLLVAIITFLTIETLALDSKFVAEARAARRSACVTVNDSNQKTITALNGLLGSSPRTKMFLAGLKDSYDAGFKDCLIKSDLSTG